MEAKNVKLIVNAYLNSLKSLFLLHRILLVRHQHLEFLNMVARIEFTRMILVIFLLLLHKLANVIQIGSLFIFGALRLQILERYELTLLDQVDLVGCVQLLAIDFLPSLAAHLLHLVGQTTEGVVRQVLENDELAEEGDVALEYLVLRLVLSLPVVFLAEDCEVGIGGVGYFEFCGTPLVLDEG